MLISDLSDTQLMLLALPIIPNMWALKHAFHHDFPTEKEKMRWLLACVFLPCIGGLAYILVGRKHASKEKIDVFERYGKKEQEGQGVPAGAEVPAEQAAPIEAIAEPAEADVLPEGRARAPWDDEPAEVAVDKPSGDALPAMKEWDFGCPDDKRKD